MTEPSEIPPLIPPSVVYTVDPPKGLSASIAEAVARAMVTIPPDKTFALMAVATEKGGNLVIAAKSPGGRFQVQAWVGKSGWTGPIKQGVEIGAQVVLVG
jgi:hypothetical protein